MNARIAADRLFIHINTVHYRLGRIAEKTGYDMRRLPDLVELLIAIRLATPDRAALSASQPRARPEQ
jgi:sugar diacid utilization regulator